MNDKSPAPAEPIPDRDGLLCLLSDYIDRSKMPYGITLHTHGLLVSGTLISAIEFFEDIAAKTSAAFAKALDREAEEGLFDVLAQITKAPDQEPTDDDKLHTVKNARYLHLKNVQIMVPGQAPVPTNPTVWRVRISEVSGFTMGTFEVAR
ncbi:hypothetical protein [Mesorhizobium sp. M0977]|uniref:hypothetical protein n=1 Tax=Mesorhizobium sp. M0977 TaxID=2957039 RepID=UPI00333DFEEB